MKKLNLLGQRFGRLVVTASAPKKGTHLAWHCQCDCGNTSIVTSQRLREQITQSCGCLSREQTAKRSTKDLTGRRFGRLIAVKHGPKSPAGFVRWECLCDCGNTALVQTGNLLDGHSTSCGCFALEDLRTRSVTHGFTRKGHRRSEYRIWAGAKKRCVNANHIDFHNYGGRGIAMCDEWLNSFETFYADMGPRPTGLTLERKDVNGPYSKENCVWATTGEQARNRRNSVRVEYEGQQYILKDLSALLGIPENRLRNQYSRLLSGKHPDLEAAIEKCRELESR